MIAIKEIKMPQNCNECSFKANDYVCELLDCAFSCNHFTERNYNCPLVEIGTCKDCKHWDKCSAPRVPDEKEYHYSPMEDFNTAEDYFCACGERR